MIFGTPNCTTIPPSTPSDAGIAGAGVLLSSTITAALALSLSGSLIFQRHFSSSASSPTASPSSSTIRRKLLSGYSDQQIIVGIGIQSVGLAKAHTLVAYHFFIIWMLSLLAMATHNATLLTFVRDSVQRDRVLRWMRQGLMGINLVLSCVYGGVLLRVKEVGLARTAPVGCVLFAGQTDAVTVMGESSVGGMDYVGTVVTIVGNVVVFAAGSWYLQMGKMGAKGGCRVVQLVGLVVMFGVAVGATVRVFLLSQAFGTPDVVLSDEGERSWSFGQLLSMLMLVLPLISVIEILRGDMAVVEPAAPEARDEKKLVDAESSIGDADSSKGE